MIAKTTGNSPTLPFCPSPVKSSSEAANTSPSFRMRANIWACDSIAELAMVLATISAGLSVSGLLYLLGCSRAILPALVIVIVAMDLIWLHNLRVARRNRSRTARRARLMEACGRAGDRV